jgi:hypothetical protein
MLQQVVHILSTLIYMASKKEQGPQLAEIVLAAAKTVPGKIDIIPPLLFHFLVLRTL